MKSLICSLLGFTLLGAEIRYVEVENRAIAPYIRSIADLCNTVYAEFPYRYDGQDNDYNYYFDTYVNALHSFACIVLDGDKPIGVITAIPLADYRPNKIKTFADHGFDVHQFAYLRELVLLPEYRGQGIGKQLYLRVENWARVNKFTYIAFAQIDESKISVCPPTGYSPLDGFWKKLGFIKHPELQFDAFYKCVGEEEAIHPMYYWVKKL